MKRVQTPHPLKLYKGRVPELLGVITIIWTTLELEIQLLIWHLADIDNHIAGRVLTNKRGVESWKEMIINLTNARTKDEETLDGLKTVIASISNAQAKRNAIIHNAYGPSPGRGTIGRYDIVKRGKGHKRKIEAKVARIKSSELKEAIEIIHRAYLDLVSWRVTYVHDSFDNTTLLPPLP